MQKKTKIFVLDTNVPLHDSSCLYKFGDNDIVIPIQLIEEIDAFKKGTEDINFHAREFIRILDTICSEHSTSGHIFNGGVSLGPKLGSVRIALAVPIDDQVKSNLRTINADAEIINLAFHLKQEHKDRDLVIVSKDANLRVKAASLGITAQDFLNDKIKDDGILSKEVITLEVQPNLIELLYQNDAPTEHTIPDVAPNQNLILKSNASNRSALVKYRAGYLYKIFKDKLKILGIKPKNAEQAYAMDALLDNQISLVTIEGKAGTGKTIITLACALSLIKEGKYDELLFTRQTISMGNREIGFLPGDADDKIAPFMLGMQDNLGVLKGLGTDNLNLINGLQENGKIKIEPLSFIRGRSLHGVILIVGEAQNLTPHEVKTIVTRAGENTKIIFIGDTRQIDHPFLDRLSNGFSYLIDRFSGQECYSHVHLMRSERSALAALAGDLL